MPNTTAPDISGVSVNPSSLRPPNHKMRDVYVSYDASDNCGAVACTLSVSSNEPVNGLGDGDTAPDWEIIDQHRLHLRSERSGKGSGRIYTITINCTDASGNTSQRSVQVHVPK